jgi:predicted DNA-binding ribbon-helix-helix protein
MCEYFVKADPISYEQRSRTIRIHGVLTSIRLENMVWDILAEMAEEEGCTTNHLIVQFHDEILAHRGEVPNFASFLRVTGMRYLRRKLTQAERAADREVAQLPNAVALGGAGLPAPKVVSMGHRS